MTWPGRPRRPLRVVSAPSSDTVCNVNPCPASTTREDVLAELRDLLDRLEQLLDRPRYRVHR